MLMMIMSQAAPTCSTSSRILPGDYVAWPDEHALVAATLWAVHTHALAAFESTPKLALLSPEQESGKTRVLELLELVVPRAAADGQRLTRQSLPCHRRGMPDALDR